MRELHEAEAALIDLRETDRPGSVWCAVLCARTVQHLIPRGEHRPADALRVAALRAQGVSISDDRIHAARTEVLDAAATLLGGWGPALGGPRAASDAADAAVSAIWMLDRKDPFGAHHATREAADAFAYSVVGDGPSDPEDGPRWGVAWQRHMDLLADLIRHQTAPIPVTTGEHPLVDWVFERFPAPQRAGTLGDALARAWRWRLRWWVPHERAIAERAERLPEWAANCPRPLLGTVRGTI